MAKNELVKEYARAYVKSKTMKKARYYCLEHGTLLSDFVTMAIEEKLEKEAEK